MYAIYLYNNFKKHNTNNMWSNSWSKYNSETSKLCVILRIDCFALGYSMHRKHTVNIHEYTYVFFSEIFAL